MKAPTGESGSFESLLADAEGLLPSQAPHPTPEILEVANEAAPASGGGLPVERQTFAALGMSVPVSVVDVSQLDASNVTVPPAAGATLVPDKGQAADLTENLEGVEEQVVCLVPMRDSVTIGVDVEKPSSQDPKFLQAISPAPRQGLAPSAVEPLLIGEEGAKKLHLPTVIGQDGRASEGKSLNIRVGDFPLPVSKNFAMPRRQLSGEALAATNAAIQHEDVVSPAATFAKLNEIPIQSGGPSDTFLSTAIAGGSPASTIGPVGIAATTSLIAVRDLMVQLQSQNLGAATTDKAEAEITLKHQELGNLVVRIEHGREREVSVELAGADASSHRALKAALQEAGQERSDNSHSFQDKGHPSTAQDGRRGRANSGPQHRFDDDSARTLSIRENAMTDEQDLRRGILA
ncbi:hypothetical protein [Sphingomicrobium astaxanthinifaciens]|nr:hypothetical protein [Sphingomicrobium astaxanthinifaciens]MCJ7420362.1 hypothetical protein [Sphingomicrobium astaxanthinifaciens]